MSTSVASPVTVSGPAFAGVSKFASSLQQVLNRSIGIASLPLNSLEAGLTTLNQRQSALQNLDLAFSGLQRSIGQLQATVQSGLLNTSISNGSIVSASLATGASEGTWQIEVDKLGSPSTALSMAGATPITAPSTQGITDSPFVTLSVGTSRTKITPASSSLQDLVSAINTQAGGQVHATIVNVGSGSSADYRLSLTAAKLGTDAIDLTDSSGNNLISSSSNGALASYRINGAPAIPTDSRTVNLAPGITLNLIGESISGQPATVSVVQDPSALESSLSSFVSSYNAAAGVLRQQHGESGGVLQGDSLIRALQSTLSHLGTYSTGTPEGALANFGITVDQTGQLSLDRTKFETAAIANFSTLLSTLGSATGEGFLKSATDLLSGIEDAGTGSVPSEESTVQKEIATQNDRIAAEQATITQLQANLASQISKADAAIASLESKVTYVTGLFAVYTGTVNNQNNGLQTL